LPLDPERDKEEEEPELVNDVDELFRDDLEDVDAKDLLAGARGRAGSADTPLTLIVILKMTMQAKQSKDRKCMLDNGIPYYFPSPISY
jgi:hypothetical protein